MPRSGALSIREVPLHTGADLAKESRIVWTGDAAAGSASVARFDGAKDGLFAKYELCDAPTGKASGVAQCVTDFSGLPCRTQSLGVNTSKKGMSCQVNIPDCLALGVKQAGHNIAIGELLDWQSAEPKMSFEFEGRKVGLHTGAVNGLDASLRSLHAAGIRVTGILLNYVPLPLLKTSPLVHPLTAAAGEPGMVSAFNTSTADGLFYYRAIVHWLVERYTREDAEYGCLAGMVIGNEVQSHWSWYHIGRVEPGVLIREYMTALRVADLATRSVHADFPLYVSLEHHWTMPAAEDQRKGLTGKQVIEGLQLRGRLEGDFPWNLAFHPYPESLGNPRFWKDHSAPLRFDAPRITFQNLEVLPAFMAQPQFLFNGKPRRIALTEQGFHSPPGADGEMWQAAAYALAWKKVQALPGIEFFLYHRHVDHPDEGGLRLGIHEHDGSPNKSGMGRARKAWDVMRQAGTPEEDAAFAFALPVVGRKDWKDVVATHFDPMRPAKHAGGTLVYDFVKHRAEAKRENLESVELRAVGTPDVVPETGMMTHPKPNGLGRLTYHVAVPAASNGSHCVLATGLLLNNEKSNGARFLVEVAGKELLRRDLRGGERFDTELDLTGWRGREVDITLAVDALADPANDWTTWVAPRVLTR